MISPTPSSYPYLYQMTPTERHVLTAAHCTKDKNKKR